MVIYLATRRHLQVTQGKVTVNKYFLPFGGAKTVSIKEIVAIFHRRVFLIFSVFDSSNSVFF